MSRPEMTDDQREIAIELLANALRKDAHLRNRPAGAGEGRDVLRTGAVRRRAEPSQRYVEGMRDMIRVLFVDGHAAADACLEAASARALGVPHDRGGR